MISTAVERPVSLPDYIKRASEGHDLSADDAYAAIDAIMSGSATASQIAALLVALALKGESIEEIAGAAAAMRAHARAVDKPSGLVMDVCGTGGDGAGTFNISTATAFVVAGAGVRVLKHGNRAMSSKCGSADVLEALGVRIDLAPERTAHILDEERIAFAFAQVHHPAMRHVAPVRREIGIRTLFNVLGPLTNPAGAQRQVVGVARRGSQATIAAVFGRLGSERVAVVHGSDGLDEMTLAGPTHVAELNDGAVHEYDLAPEDAGLERRDTASLRGGDAATNASQIRSVLSGTAGALRDVVVLNAALALHVAEMAPTLHGARAIAELSIDSGAARDRLEALVRASNA